MGRSRLIVIGGVVILLVAAGVAAALFLRPASAPGMNVAEARTMIERGDYEAARDALVQIAGREPENGEVQFLLGVAYFNLGQYDEAKAAFEQAMRLDPDRAAAVHHNLGALAYQQGDVETALAEFRQAVELDPDDADSHYQLGATYLVKAFPPGAVTPDADWLAKAVEEFNESLKLAPGKVEALVGLGNVYLLQNEVDKAVEMLEQAVEKAPEMREALFALGRAYALQGETAKAKETLQRFLDTNPPILWKQQAEEILAGLP